MKSRFGLMLLASTMPVRIAYELPTFVSPLIRLGVRDQVPPPFRLRMLFSILAGRL